MCFIFLFLNRNNSRLLKTTLPITSVVFVCFQFFVFSTIWKSTFNLWKWIPPFSLKKLGSASQFHNLDNFSISKKSLNFFGHVLICLFCCFSFFFCVQSIVYFYGFFLEKIYSGASMELDETLDREVKTNVFL